MTDLERVLVAVVSDLDRIGRRYALVGGLAVAVRAEPRLTRNVDLAVSVASDHEAEAVLRALIGTGHRVVATVEQDVTGRLTAARLTREEPAVGVVCDLLFASSGIEPEIVSGAEPIEVLAGLVLPVASVGHLIAMKLLARDDRQRPADADDLRALAAVAGEDDWAVAAAATEEITARGCHRGRDLPVALTALRAGGAY